MELTDFKALAPTASLVSGKESFLMMFLKVDDGVYYLLNHKTKPLSNWRKILAWPFVDERNMLITGLTIALLAAIAAPFSFENTNGLDANIGLRFSIFLVSFVCLCTAWFFASFSFYKRLSISQWDNAKWIEKRR